MCQGKMDDDDLPLKFRLSVPSGPEHSGAVQRGGNRCAWCQRVPSLRKAAFASTAETISTLLQMPALGAHLHWRRNKKRGGDIRKQSLQEKPIRIPAVKCCCSPLSESLDPPQDIHHLSAQATCGLLFLSKQNPTLQPEKRQNYPSASCQHCRGDDLMHTTC